MYLLAFMILLPKHFKELIYILLNEKLQHFYLTSNIGSSYSSQSCNPF